MVHLQGALTHDRVAELERVLDRAAADGDGPVVLDLSKVTSIDSAGMALLSVFARRMESLGRPVDLDGVGEKVGRMLDMFPSVGSRKPEAVEVPARFERLGDWVLTGRDAVVMYASVVADTLWFTMHGLLGRSQIRWGLVMYEMSVMGARAVGVVGLIAFLVGGTMALQAAAQLRQFGANIFVVDLVGVSLTREFGPLMAAIVVAGRSGSAVAAEIGTMMVSEEVDALKTMGVNPVRFLVVPKFIAISITQPILTVLADVFGIFGGFLVAVLYLDVGVESFLERLEQALFVKDLLTGLVKSVLFAQIIVTVGAMCGFRTRGGADAVGRSTTMSVVVAIFVVIAADAVASLVFYFGD